MNRNHYHSSVTPDKLSLTEIMLVFVRAAVLERAPAIPIDVVIDWEGLMDIATKQGLLAWVWDGICKLPVEQQPPRQQRINWGLSAQEIWERYDLQKKVLKNMVEVCEQNDMCLLVFKGFGMSECYPDPHSRPAGDIDIYLFGDYEKGNELFAAQSKKDETYKRCEFTYRGVKIENHRCFFTDFYKKYVQIDRYIKSTIVEAKKTKDGYYLFPYYTNLVMNVVHAVSHMENTVDPLTLRSILDIAVLLQSSSLEHNAKQCKKIMRQLGISKVFDLFVCMSEWILDIDLSIYHIRKIPAAHVDAFKDQLFKSKNTTDDNTEGWSISQYRRYYQKRKWMHQYLVWSAKERWLTQFRMQFGVLTRIIFNFIGVRLKCKSCHSEMAKN